MKEEGGLSKFPRLKRRGPIEARLFAKAKPLHCMFPRLKRRGPIEAFLAVTEGFGQCLVSTPEKAWPH